MLGRLWKRGLSRRDSIISDNQQSPIFLDRNHHIDSGVFLDVNLKLGEPAGNSTRTEITMETENSGFEFSSEGGKLVIRARGDFERNALAQAFKWLADQAEIQ